MAVQLLEQDGLGAAHGGAHAPWGQIECGGDLGVAEAAVPEHQRGWPLWRSVGGAAAGELGPLCRSPSAAACLCGSRASAARTELRSSRVMTRSATSGA